MKKNFYKLIYFLVTVCILSCMFGKVLLVNAEEYQYDDNGRVVSVKHDDGSVTEYEYDKNGNIISIKTKAGTNKAAGEEQKPAGEDGKPNGEEDKPSREESKPVGEEAKPTAEDQKPVGEEAKPTAEDQKQAGTGQKNGNASDNDSKDSNDGMRTGDETLLVPVGLLMLVSIAMVIVLIYKKKYNKNGEDK